MKYTRPLKLKKGDTVAILSLSSGAAAAFPHVYESGINFLKSLDLKIKEYPTTRKDSEYLLNHPDERACDLNNAFKDKEVKAIICTIGGNESVRILPYLNKDIIKRNPKIFMGFSDVTTIHVFLNQLGIMSFYGPSVMAGLSQAKSLPKEFTNHIKDLLFADINNYEYKPYEYYSEGYPDWSKESNVGKVNKKNINSGPKVLQGTGIVSGQLFGGCMEVLEVLKGTVYWPKGNFWVNKILFFETSEEKPNPNQIGWFLRNYGAQGILHTVSAIIFAIPRDYSKNETTELETVIKKVVSVEFGLSNLPIMMNLNFGHTDPQMIIVEGANAEIDFSKIHIKIN